jgi:integrase
MARTSNDPNTRKSAYGMVRPYTRHLEGCKSKNNACHCPKWLYEHRKGAKPRRYTLITPSWSEAQSIASKTLEGFNPDIAAARALVAQSDAKRTSIPDACLMWMDRTERDYGSASGIVAQYKSITKKLKEWAERERIEWIQDVTPMHLESWYASEDWKHYSDTTRNQRWSVLRSIFRFWHEREVIEKNPVIAIKPSKLDGDPRQGPYSDKQLESIFAHIAECVPANIPTKEQAVYAVRLHAFITLLLNTGCDVVDAVLFDKANVTTQAVSGKKVPVYRYHRQKTGKQAIIPLPNAIAGELRKVPMLERNPANMPFKSERDLQTDVNTWRYRIQSVLGAAKVKFVELPRDKHGKARRKAANAKQFRHTFAIRQLVAGQREETVAKMLGHADTEMIRTHYGAWVPERDDAHVREILEVRSRR